MEEEKKYPFVSEVRILAEEYRDLIEQLAEAKKEKEDANRNYWDIRSKLMEHEKLVEAQKKKISLYSDFMVENPEIGQKYKEFCLQKVMNDNEET